MIGDTTTTANSNSTATAILTLVVQYNEKLNGEENMKKELNERALSTSTLYSRSIEHFICYFGANEKKTDEDPCR